MAQAAARRETLRNAFTLPAAAHDEARLGRASPRRSTTTSTRPAALAILHEWASSGQLELLRRGLDVFGLGSLAEREEAPPEVAELAARRAQRARPSGTSRPPTGYATSWPRSAGRCATGRTAATTSCARDARPRLRPAGRARGAARPAGGARAVGDRAGGRRRSTGWPRTQRRSRRPTGSSPNGRRRATTRAFSRSSSRIGTPTPTSSPQPSGRSSRCSTGSPTRATSAPSPQRRGSGSDRRRRPGARLGGRHAGRRARVGRRRSSICRSPSSRTSRATSRR